VSLLELRSPLPLKKTTKPGGQKILGKTRENNNSGKDKKYNWFPLKDTRKEKLRERKKTIRRGTIRHATEA